MASVQPDKAVFVVVVGGGGSDGGRDADTLKENERVTE